MLPDLYWLMAFVSLRLPGVTMSPNHWSPRSQRALARTNADKTDSRGPQSKIVDSFLPQSVHYDPLSLKTGSITLAANRIASVEDVDRAWMGIMKMPVGPFGMLDDVGLDTAWEITDFWAKALDDPQLRANAAFLRGYLDLDRGRTGVKSGAGFYEYPDPAYQAPGFLESGA